MKPEQRTEIRARINRELEETRRDIDSLSELVKPVAPDNAIGRLSRLEAIGAKSINEASLVRAKTRLEQLKSVLADLDNPDFGTCVECDKPIPVGRIMLMPESRLCVRCAGNCEKKRP
jgi:DnaK suppressor protein